MKRFLKNIFFCGIIAVLIVGCGKNKASDSKDDYMFNKIEKTDNFYSDEKRMQIQEEISGWAKSYLFVDSGTDEEEQEILDESLYDSIVSRDEREKVETDRKELRKKGQVTVGLVTTEISSAQTVKYEEQEMGLVSCTVNIKGNIDGEKFEREYNLELLIDYGWSSISIYEIGKIDWKDI